GGGGEGTPWRTGPWPMRSERLFLVPGDSPMGYRLPLEALPWVTPEARVVLHEPDPFAPRVPLPGGDGRPWPATWAASKALAAAAGAPGAGAQGSGGGAGG